MSSSVSKYLNSFTIKGMLTGSIEVLCCLKTRDDFWIAFITTCCWLKLSRVMLLPVSLTRSTLLARIEWILNNLRSRMLPKRSRWGILFTVFLGDFLSFLAALSSWKCEQVFFSWLMEHQDILVHDLPVLKRLGDTTMFKGWQLINNEFLHFLRCHTWIKFSALLMYCEILRLTDACLLRQVSFCTDCNSVPMALR